MIINSNSIDAQKSNLRGIRYRNEKKQGERSDLTCGNDYQKSTTAEKIASQFGVSEKTIRNDEKFADGLDEIGVKIVKIVLQPWTLLE